MARHSGHRRHRQGLDRRRTSTAEHDRRARAAKGTQGAHAQARRAGAGAMYRGTKRRGEMTKILYVEDNEDNVYMLKRRLLRAGFSVVIANNGTQGVAMATSEQPD